MIPKKLHFSWVHNDLEVAMVGPKVDLTFEHEVCFDPHVNIIMCISRVKVHHIDFLM